MLWACVKCSARYSAGAPCCPQCGSTTYQEAPGGAVAEGTPVLDAAVPGAKEAPVPPKAEPKTAAQAGAKETAS